MSQPLISVLHATRRVGPSEAFPRGWRDAFEAYLRNADNPDRVEYVIAVYESRWAEFWKHSGFSHWATDGDIVRPGPCSFSVVVVKNTRRDCIVDQCNAAAAASSGLLLTGAQDDLYPPDSWDSLGLDARASYRLIDGGKRVKPPAQLEDDEVVIRCSSGSPRDAQLTIAGFTSRRRYERLGYLLHPDFESMYADDYFDWELRRDGAAGLCAVVERPDIAFEHRHPTFGKGMADEAYREQNNPVSYFNGRNTLARLTGQPVQRCVAVCLPGETFRSEWVHRWTGLFGHLTQVHQFMVLPYFCYTSNVYATRIELAKGVLESPIPADFILSIDDDNTLTPEHFDMLLKDLEEHPDLDGVVGWCWCDNHQADASEARTWVMSVGRQGPNMECSRFSPSDFESAEGGYLLGSDQIPEPEGFWSGLPCVLMRRRVLEVLTPGAFAPIFKAEINYGFSGEDTAFFWRARQAGLKFACDFRVKVPHVKWRVIEPVFVEGNKPVPVPQLESVGAD